MPIPEVPSRREQTFAAPGLILVATDLTDADYLLPCAIAQAKASGAHITLIHVICPAILIPVDVGVTPYIDEAAIANDVELNLQAMAHRVESEGVACDTLLEHGAVEEMVRKAVISTGAARLMMGTHGRGRARQFVLGSIAQLLLRSTDIPIFTVGPHAHAQESRLLLPARILHPVSLVGNYQAAAALAVDVAQAYNAELTLLHVCSVAQRNNGHPCIGEEITEAVAALVPSARTLKTPLHVCVKTGHLVGEILKAATETGADWIVLGVDGDLPFWPLQDSTAYKVIAASHCPVLSLRHNQNPHETRQEQKHVKYAETAPGSYTRIIG